MMGNLSNEDKMHICRLHKQGYGDNARTASYPYKNWSLNTLKMICRRVNEMDSAVTRHAGSGRLICYEFIDKAMVSFRSRLSSSAATVGGHFGHTF